MKRLLVLVLASALIAATLVGCTPAGPRIQASGTLIVGSPEISGNFVTGFGNSAYDNWVRTLINGYETYSTTPGGEIVLNETVVKKLDTEVDAEGNKTYTFEIHKDLKYNDGSKVTAEDFVFYYLWNASPLWTEVGASSSVGEGLVGYQAYLKGETDRFKGVKLISDYKFAVTIDKEELPYYYENVYAACNPIPKHVWAPNATIDQNDDGAKISGENLKDDFSRIASQERFNPTVTAGPYKFVSFGNGTVTVKVNEHFKGTFEKKLPQLEYVIIRSIPQDTDVDQVILGDVDAVTGVIEGEKIEKAKAADTTTVNYYARNGFGGVFMHCDFGPTKDAKVRHALAYLIDRDTVILNVLGGYGSVTNGYYGLAQWMYEDNKAAIDAFPHFTLNIDKANQLLDETEWKYEADGTTPFDPAKADGNYFRYNQNKEMLAIHHFGTDENQVTDNVEIQFKANAHKAGVKWDIARGDFDALLALYYYAYDLDPSERYYHTFNLATNFGTTFDPYYSFHSDWLGTWYNSEQLNDPELDEIMIKMRRLDPTEKAKFSEYWLEFQQRWYDLLPVIPLYSNEYYDVFRKEVKGFNTTPFADWADIICDIHK